MMISIYFQNEETVHLTSAVTVEYRSYPIQHSDGSSSETPAWAVCLDEDGEEVGAFLLDQIVGWDAEEWQDDEDEDDEDDEDEEDE